MPDIQHVFVLMLENRSFDHMLGFSGLKGIDADAGTHTEVDGLKGSETNVFNGVRYDVGHPARDSMKVDPGHEFTDVLEQLCGSRASYPKGGPYPSINNSGFVSNYSKTCKHSRIRRRPSLGDAMLCMQPAQVPVLTKLASEFAVCDSWFSSMPGPTWPNRLFALAASSGGLDHSPRMPHLTTRRLLRGFPLRSIFDRVKTWRIYSGQCWATFALALQGVHLLRDVWDLSRFQNDLHKDTYDIQFTWIEPNYGHVWSDFKGGTSQHPRDGVAGGESLIKTVYEVVRNSGHWETSVLIITWDEHGGFYDHVAPPDSTRPSSTASRRSPLNKNRFMFDKYGPRVPAIIVSPFTAKNIIDHRVYDHSSIPATVEHLFDLAPLTDRDNSAKGVEELVSEPLREDTPEELPDAPAGDGTNVELLDANDIPLPDVPNGDDLIAEEGGNLPGFLYLATRAYLQASTISERSNILEQSTTIRTRQEARDFCETVRQRIATIRGAMLP